jgi:hypothetical protein
VIETLRDAIRDLERSNHHARVINDMHACTIDVERRPNEARAGVGAPLTEHRKEKLMAVLIHHRQGLRTLYLTFCQRLVQFKESGDPADTKISHETFPDPARANNALHAGKVSWESFDWDDDELRINVLKELYTASIRQSRS